MSSKNVALALSSGGPRGFAYIGAIEQLLSRGYQIISVAGTSVGSLVGGIFAAGALDSFKEWLFSLDPAKVVSLMDFSLSKNYLVKGEKVINAIREVVPERNIEDLDIPFRCVATDLYTGEEVVFSNGPLFEAIRASISIPSMFRPVQWQGRTLVDGGLVNTFPLNRVARRKGDILAGFNVNSVDVEAIRSYQTAVLRLGCETEALRERSRLLLDEVLSGSGRLGSRLHTVREKGAKLIEDTLERRKTERELLQEGKENKLPVDADGSYYSILDRSFSIMNHTIAKMSIGEYKPEILAELPFDAYTSIGDYGRAREISERGRELMAAAIDRYEAATGLHD